MGDLAFLFYKRRGAVAYANLKSCLGETVSPSELLRLERKVFQNVMQTAVEVLRFPKVDKTYLDRYVTIDSLEKLAAAKQKGKGMIALTAHFGNWELQSVAASSWGYPMQVLARQQKFPKVNQLLNRYREQTGCRVISKGFATREIIRHLEANGLVGILTDQDAGQNGVFVNFFGRPTSFAPGPIAFALRTGCEVIPCFIRREHHAFHRIDVTEPIQVTKSGNEAEDIRRGLQQFAERLEGYIRKYPDQWLWLHKRWKSSPVRAIAILSDGKAGHVNQSLGVADSLEKMLRERGLSAESRDRIEVRFKSKWRRIVLAAFSVLADRFSHQGQLNSVRFALTEESYRQAIRPRYDFVISTGSSLAPVNRILSLENVAKGIVVMDPVIPPAAFFDLAIVPEHDRPPPRSNIVQISGAPHSLTGDRLRKESERLIREIGKPDKPFLGLLVGGETAEFQWGEEEFSGLVSIVNEAAKKFDFNLLVTTSRRSSKTVETIFQNAWGNDPRCKLLVLANQKNLDGVVPGILGVSKVVVVTGESMSMVSEAVSAEGQVVVFLPNVRRERSKIEKMLRTLEERDQVLLAEEKSLAEVIEKAFRIERKHTGLDDRLKIEAALRRII